MQTPIETLSVSRMGRMTCKSVGNDSRQSELIRRLIDKTAGPGQNRCPDRSWMAQFVAAVVAGAPRLQIPGRTIRSQKPDPTFLANLTVCPNLSDSSLTTAFHQHSSWLPRSRDPAAARRFGLPLIHPGASKNFFNLPSESLNLIFTNYKIYIVEVATSAATYDMSAVIEDNRGSATVKAPITHSRPISDIVHIIIAANRLDIILLRQRRLYLYR
ncbi:hypothetical protein J6590_051662 [Homalodisca vitripennis]|nr:hypothetical protein J6590_051662 [Homalodisca vitripennis]